jgi:DOMON domain
MKLSNTYLLCFIVLIITGSTKIVAALPSKDVFDVEEIVPQKIYDAIDGNQHERSLQLSLCVDYEYVAYIRDDLTMSYFVTSDRISIELLYEGEAWIGLGTNPNGSGKMVGAEAWLALPDVDTVPSIYDLNGKRKSTIAFGSSQTLRNGEVIQQNGQTIMRFEKLLNDDPNVSINGAGDEVFIWAIGGSNSFGRHRRRGAFRIKLEPCVAPSVQKEEVKITVECGFLGLSLFCPLTFCGPLGRTLGLCNSF